MGERVGEEELEARSGSFAHFDVSQCSLAPRKLFADLGTSCIDATFHSHTPISTLWAPMA